MSCRCADTKEKAVQTPDCAASKSTTVTTPEGKEVKVTFNMGTGEVSYDDVPSDASDQASRPGRASGD